MTTNAPKKKKREKYCWKKTKTVWCISFFQLAHSHDVLNWQDVSSPCEGLPGREQHVSRFQVVGLIGTSVTPLWRGVAQRW